MSWTKDQWELWEERAAIMEFDAGLPRAEAEQKAMDDLLGQGKWQFCKVCTQKGPVFECWLCEQLNGRPMTDEEVTALMTAAQKAWEAANPGWEKKVPYAD